jgi:hypothetical protein
MKFKITKSQVDILLGKFKKDDNPFEEVVLEPVIDTASQALYEQDIRNTAYKQGYDYGRKEGYLEGREGRAPCCCRRCF